MRTQVGISAQRNCLPLFFPHILHSCKLKKINISGLFDSNHLREIALRALNIGQLIRKGNNLFFLKKNNYIEIKRKIIHHSCYNLIKPLWVNSYSKRKYCFLICFIFLLFPSMEKAILKWEHSKGTLCLSISAPHCPQ